MRLEKFGLKTIIHYGNFGGGSMQSLHVSQFIDRFDNFKKDGNFDEVFYYINHHNDKLHELITRKETRYIYFL